MQETYIIPRMDLFELHDQPWFPGMFREALTEWLRALWEHSEAAGVTAPVLAEAIKRSGAKRIVDLCSGGTGPMIPVLERLDALGARVAVLATDKFPDTAAMAELTKKTDGRMTGCLDSVDALNLPEEMTGLRTLWASFHHFRPEDARGILSDACESGQPIAIFEFTERTLLKVLLSMPASFLGVFLLIFKMRPFRLDWWFFTWVLPVIPAIVAWDGLVSHLRTYTRSEMLELTEGLPDHGYRWETGRVRAPRAGLEVSYLIGRPL